MKKIVGTLLTLLTAAGLFAQQVPQPAFRLLDGYLERRSLDAEYGAKNGPWFLMGTGVVLGAAAATVWFAGDDIARSSGMSPMPSQTRFATTLGLGLGAAVLTGIGFVLHQSPPRFDERERYAAIYHETDPAVQESMAVARLKGLAETAKDSRMVSGWMNLAITGAIVGFRVADNQGNGRPMTDGLFTPWGWGLGSLVGSATSLLVKSPEEMLYEEYQYVAARSAKD